MNLVPSVAFKLQLINIDRTDLREEHFARKTSFRYSEDDLKRGVSGEDLKSRNLNDYNNFFFILKGLKFCKIKLLLLL